MYDHFNTQICILEEWESGSGIFVLFISSSYGDSITCRSYVLTTIGYDLRKKPTYIGLKCNVRSFVVSTFVFYCWNQNSNLSS